MELTSKHIERLLDDQLAVWDSARNNYQALESVRVKEIPLGGCTVKVQFNPARIVSSAAKVDTKSLKERKCFLCVENRPEVQHGLPDGEYTWLINPFPIFPKHFTIPVNRHTPQLIGCRFGDMLRLAREADDFVLFYNGPKCGASAPDHAHFQAGNAELCIRMSILQFMEKEHVTTLLDTRATEITDSGVHIENGEGKSFLPADTVIIATGTTPLIEERDSFKNVSFDVINIGDCKKASNMQHAIETGFDAGLIL